MPLSLLSHMSSPHQRDSMGIESDPLAPAAVKSEPVIFPTIWNNAHSSLDLLAFGVFSALLVFHVPWATRTRQGRGNPIMWERKGGELLQAAASHVGL